jgi:hypothetical protein
MALKEARSVLCEIKEQEWMLWQHNPITAAYLQFMDDQIAAWRELGMDLLEGGAFRLGDPSADRNPDVVRGQLLAARGLRGITLGQIQAFYADQEPADEAEDTEA